MFSASFSQPHSTAGNWWRAISAASAVPQEPAPSTATLGRFDMRSGVARRLAADRRLLLLLLLGALAQALGVQRLEVDRLQQERREAAGLDQVADQLARIRVEHVRAVGTEHGVEHLRLEAGQGEHARLLHFAHVDGAVLV